jgi:hypothetical protein
MSDFDDAKQIVHAVTTAVTAIAPATGPAAPFLTLAATGIEAILSLAEGLGHERDAVLASLDAAYAAAKARTDADLAAKHRGSTVAEKAERMSRAIRGGPATADDLPVRDTEPPPPGDEEDGA